MKNSGRRYKARGFTLVEVVITLAIFGAALAVVLYYQQRTGAASKAHETSKALIQIVSKIRMNYLSGSGYSGLDYHWPYDAQVVPPPLRRDTTYGAVNDPWGNIVDIVGGSTFFVIDIPRPANSDPEACISMVSTLGRAAREVWLGTGLTVSDGVIVGAAGPSTIRYKDPETPPTAASLVQGCAIANGKISLQFD
jgi:prepilin-type N-terminal cleavage/methylation domain-containing protein